MLKDCTGRHLDRNQIQRSRLHSLSGRLFQRSVMLTIHNFILLFELYFLMFHFLTIATSSIVALQWKQSTPLDMTYKQRWDSPPQPSSLHAEQTQLSQPFFIWEILVAFNSSPSAGLFLGHPCLFWTGEPRTWHSAPESASLGQSREEGSSPSTCCPFSF